ncbi:MAG TPA: histidine phosphatase family protein [Solirubrobacteraceae bacterium]|nr:histidine phosphatase family protein [Solirubrobacteraceae bacterium]
MAKQLWLLRHGEAEPHDARPDAERRLTDRGREQARDVGRALAALKIHFHAAYTSPRVRARDTATLACEPLGVEPIDHEPLSGGFTADDALTLLAVSGAEQRVLVVGHDPDFSQVVYDLTGGRIEFKKGAIAAIRLDGARGELMLLMRPRELARIS